MGMSHTPHAPHIFSLHRLVWIRLKCYLFRARENGLRKNVKYTKLSQKSPYQI